MIKKILFTGFILNFIFNSLAQNPSFEWAKSMGAISYDYSYDVAVDDSGNVYTTGYFQGTVDFDPGSGVYNLTSSGRGIFIAKLDVLGNFVWAKSITGTGHCSASSIALGPSGSGSVYFTGSFIETADFAGAFNLTSIGENTDIFICKLDSLGSFVWAKSMGGSSYQYGFSIKLDLLGNIYTTGYFRGVCDFNPDPSEIFNLTSIENDDIFISKLDNAGNFVWAKQIGGAGDDYGLSLTLNASGELLITGAYFSPAITFDMTTLTNSFSGGYTCDMFIANLKPETLGVGDEVKSENFILYPNPVTDYLSLIFSGNIQEVEVNIIDITGKIVKIIKPESSTIYVGDLVNGIYIVELVIKGNAASQKFVKQ